MAAFESNIFREFGLTDKRCTPQCLFKIIQFWIWRELNLALQFGFDQGTEVQEFLKTNSIFT